MRTSTILAALLAPAYNLAQPTLDATNTVLAPGPVYLINVSSIVDPGPAGANVVWDLSALAITATATVTLVDPADEPDAAVLFPHATLITANDLSGQVKGYENTATYIDSWGVFNNNNQLLLQQSNAVRELVLPCTFGTTWTDTDEATYFFGGSQVGGRTGTTTGTADAYGELILPFGSFTNVIRVHLEQSVNDNTDFGSAVTTGDRYQYYLPGFPAPLAEIIDFTSVSGTDVTTDQRVQWVNELSTALATRGDASFDLSLSPNPTTDRTTVVLPTEGATHVHVLDAMGRIVLSIVPALDQRTVMLELNGLSPGAYSVRVQGRGASVRTARLVKL
ncbi:MAG: T9SS type A sorting domain-containing protein [Flavobacteriales bacterium]|nr:T9SS type A sorting domain-containing protein [Flavobacteriales bacterium]